jgi:hypothetical protein
LENGLRKPTITQVILMELVFRTHIKEIFPELYRKAKIASVRRLRAMERKLMERATRKKRVSLNVVRLARIRAAIESRLEDHDNDQAE